MRDRYPKHKVGKLEGKEVGYYESGFGPSYRRWNPEGNNGEDGGEYVYTRELIDAHSEATAALHTLTLLIPPEVSLAWGEAFVSDMNRVADRLWELTNYTTGDGMIEGEKPSLKS